MVIFNKTGHKKLWEYLGIHPELTIKEAIKLLDLTESQVNCCKVAGNLMNTFRFVSNTCSLCPLDFIKDEECPYIRWDKSSITEREHITVKALAAPMNPITIDELVVLN